jgi:Mor family transcriptional regulator
MPDISDFADIYREIAEEICPETAVEIHRLFGGQQIIFPQKLYRKEYIYRCIRKRYNGRNVRELAVKYGYSDRQIRRILRESKMQSKKTE